MRSSNLNAELLHFYEINCDEVSTKQLLQFGPFANKARDLKTDRYNIESRV